MLVPQELEMYYVIQKKFIYFKFSFIWTKYEKDNDN
jgi:hypothetical protein